jgi:hypothetical protein
MQRRFSRHLASHVKTLHLVAVHLTRRTHIVVGCPTLNHGHGASHASLLADLWHVNINAAGISCEDRLPSLNHLLQSTATSVLATPFFSLNKHLQRGPPQLRIWQFPPQYPDSIAARRLLPQNQARARVSPCSGPRCLVRRWRRMYRCSGIQSFFFTAMFSGGSVRHFMGFRRAIS